MHSQRLLALLCALAAGVVAQEAVVTVNNPPSLVLKATLPETRFFAGADLVGNVKGEITARAPADGKGVLFQVTLSNFPKSGGPFTYHLHAQPAVNGDCISTKAHLDPFAAGEDHVCDPTKPALCQVGDLSGKHGKITSDPFTVQYLDPYASTDASNAAFFGDKSFVVHYANKTRITCANFGQYREQPPSSSSTSSSSAPSAHAPTVLPTGSAHATTRPGAAAPTGAGKGGSVPFIGAAPVVSVSLPLVALMLLAL